MIWLRSCREKKEKIEQECEKSKLEITFELEKQKRLLFADIRFLIFQSLGITDQSAASRLWYDMPSMADVKKETKIIGRSRRITTGK